MKKILSMTLALLMVITAVITCAPVSAIAADGDATVIAPDTTWYDASKTSFDISTAAQWYGLAKLISEETTAGSVTSGKTFNLVADIDLNPGWNAAVTVTKKDDGKNYAALPAAPVNSANVARLNTFAGTLNGNGHTLSGYYFKGAETQKKGQGGVINVLKGTVKDLVITNSLVTTTGSAIGAYACGLVVDFQKGVIENVYADIEVWQLGWRGSADVTEGDTTIKYVAGVCGLVGTRSEGGGAGTNGDNLSVLKNVVFAGVIGKCHATSFVITGNGGSSRSCQIIFDYKRCCMTLTDNTCENNVLEN